ncbi:MAG: tetratricopeptide repeat protein [Verrucomicrobia bacterium]|nr:tetratricopeptide repeat protein [Verrucomicrobiota bacterium]
MKIFSAKKFRVFAVVGTVMLGAVVGAGNLSAQTPATNTQPEPASQVATQDLVRAYLAIQEQLHATQLALERNRQEAEAEAGRNAVALTRRLNVIERFMAEQRSEESRTVLLIAVSVAGAGLLAALLATLMQMRALKHLAEATPSLSPQALQLAAGPEATRLLGSGAAEAGARLTATIERLQKRIQELETAAPPTGGKAEKTGSGQIVALLTKGQSLLGAGQAAEALRVFEEALGLNPNHAEALVKKGAALEKLAKLDEAIACYDRAIAADASLTIAYLNKGGVFNRQQRYDEALVCYEQALKTQDKAHAP